MTGEACWRGSVRAQWQEAEAAGHAAQHCPRPDSCELRAMERAGTERGSKCGRGSGLFLSRGPCCQETGLGDSVVFLVLAPAGTAGTVLLHHGLAALVEDGLAFATPGRKRQVLLVPMGRRPPLGPEAG